MNAGKMLSFVLIVSMVFLMLSAFIGVYVCRDAKRRGMNVVLWTLIVVIAPALGGFIIYLLVRGGHPDLECPQCGTQVTEQYVVCPQCGARLRYVCPNCAAPVERDWKVCPRCAAPLDGAWEGVTPPRRRQDKALGKVLAAIVVVPVVLVAILIGTYAMRPQGGSATLQEVTFDEYDQLQPSDTVRNAVHRWLDAMEVRTDRAYALRYDLPGEYDYENRSYFLIYVPAGGQQTSMSFGLDSGLFGSTLDIRLENTGYSGSLFCVEATAEKAPTPKIALDGRNIRCSVQKVDYNPTMFLIYPDYSQMGPEEVLFLPERISVVKLERTGEGSSKTVDSMEVTDEDTLFKLMAAIDGGERLDWGHPIYSGCDISGGFEVIIEYQVHEEYIFHDDMARLRVFQQDGACYLIDNRSRHGDNFRLMNWDFYGLLEGLFE
ncbi:MAG: zinc ribbon domain-containing protein [Oscillospiraceae bacterium]|nr:zinc ribbon domain-containing protein [Oscillospiraceae bacterium]